MSEEQLSRLRLSLKNLKRAIKTLSRIMPEQQASRLILDPAWPEILKALKRTPSGPNWTTAER